MVRKDWASQNSIALSWQEPDFPNGAILDYEIKYYEKVGIEKNETKPSEHVLTLFLLFINKVQYHNF